MTEPDVTLTDYALTLVCAIFAWLLHRQQAERSGLRGWMVAFFSSAALAPLFGGTVHGFFADDSSPGHAILWSLSLLSIGVTALSAWVIGAKLVLGPTAERWLVRAAWLQLSLYAGVVLFVNHSFWVAIAQYAPAALFLLTAFAVAARREAGVALGAWGLGLVFIASALQQLQIGVHPIYFSHNSLYHVVQAVALALIFGGFRRLLRSTEALHAHAT